MSDATEFIKQIKDQINYTQRLEEAYITKHTEIEYLYARLRELMNYAQSNKSGIPQINKMLDEIEKLISKNSIVREEQLQVLHDSKIVLEELNEEPNVDTEVLGPLIKSIDSKIPDDFAPLIQGLKLDKSKKNKKNKKSKKSKKSKKK